MELVITNLRNDKEILRAPGIDVSTIKTLMELHGLNSSDVGFCIEEEE